VVNFGGKDVAAQLPELSVSEIKAKAGTNDLSIVDISRAEEIRSYIDKIKKAGDTIGGIVEVRATNVPAGLGSYVHFDRKLDAKIAAAVVSINAFKGVEFGLGFEAGRRQGSQVMDEILWTAQTGYSRKSNNLGGFEGGMTNGEDLVIRGVMKPIPTLYKPLMSVNTETHEPYKASVERSDPTALPAAGVVMENVVATVIAQEICDKFSSDSFRELQEAFQNYKERLKNF
ncbi:MAG: chorismate synthase, partial [Lactococcus garvieae]